MAADNKTFSIGNECCHLTLVIHMTEPNFWQLLIPGVEVYFRSWHQQDHSQAGGHRVDPRHPHLRRKGDFVNIFDFHSSTLTITITGIVLEL